jgi:hypothetical protein
LQVTVLQIELVLSMESVMSNQIWKLVPHSGIKSVGIDIFFGIDRQKLRAAMLDRFLPPKESRFPDEDDFLTENESTFIRVRYSGVLVRDIEFLKGSLNYDGINIHSETTFPEIEKEFKSRGLTFRGAKWLGDGKDCPELCINIATREDVGGDGDGIEWVIMSSDFK